MNYRWIASLSGAAVAAGLLAVVPVAGQPAAKAKPAAKSRTLPRTIHGQPDLQGVWTNMTLTPLERPAALAAKQFFTEEEVAGYEKQQLQQVNADRRDGGGAADVGRAYNEFWRDRGRVVPSRRTSLIVDPENGRVPPLTPEAQKRNAARAQQRKLHPADGPEDRSLAERCIAVSNAGPPMMPANYNANYQIVQNREYVLILSEQIHDARIIPLDGRPHLAPGIRQYLGDARGRWEENTLVVETTNFTALTSFQGSGEGMRLVERLTRTGPTTMTYEFTVDDPGTFTRPWTAQIPMNKVAGPIYEYACHEGNYGIAGSLAGFRAEERAAEAAKGGSK
jgi:hypothetical protein